jgi:hypothetical protein
MPFGRQQNGSRTITKTRNRVFVIVLDPFRRGMATIVQEPAAETCEPFSLALP